MASDHMDYTEDSDLFDSTDFTIDELEIAKGSQAVSDYLVSIKTSEIRQAAEDHLHTLAVLISGGSCDATDFPWHQLRSYHSAAAISLLREEGIPAKIEGWRCSLDSTRKFHQVPPRYPANQVQKIAGSLHKVLRVCHNLGYLSAEERDRAIQPSKAQSAPLPKSRVLTDGEFRALAATCNMDTSPAGPRDALVLYLGFLGGLRVGEIAAVASNDLHFDNRRGEVTVRIREAGKSRARVVPLQNDALIALEDWMELRGEHDGPLLCPIRRGNKLEIKRLSAADIKSICETRAKRAGVPPFAAQELRRNWELRSRAKRRKSPVKPQTTVSALFDADEAAPEAGSGPEKIRFPYQGRPQSLT